MLLEYAFILLHLPCTPPSICCLPTLSKPNASLIAVNCAVSKCAPAMASLSVPGRLAKGLKHMATPITIPKVGWLGRLACVTLLQDSQHKA